MIPIEDFRYGVDIPNANPIHERLLLLKTRSKIGDKFAVGYYDCAHDVFEICSTPFKQTRDHVYHTRPVNNHTYKDYHCIMPPEFMRCIGPRCLSHFMTMEDVLEFLATHKEHKLLQNDIDTLLDSQTKFFQPYLVITHNKEIIITETGGFADGKGTQFCASSPETINGATYHMSGSLPRNTIRYAVDLKELYKISTLADSAKPLKT